MSFRASPPAVGRTKSCGGPSPRFDTNARWRPSGDHRGEASASPVVSSRGFPSPEAGTVQILDRFSSESLSAVVTTYATVAPSGLSCGSEANGIE